MALIRPAQSMKGVSVTAVAARVFRTRYLGSTSS